MILILTGAVGSGKTGFLRKLITYLGSEGIAVAGFFCPRVFKDDELIGYDLVDAGSLRKQPFLRKGEAENGGETVGPYRVEPGVQAAANAILSASAPSAQLIVDELGPLELRGKGHWPSLAPLLNNPERNFLFIIRDECLDDFAKLLAGHPTKVFSMKDRINVSVVVSEIQSHIPRA
ncbi:MAG: nucleoside-triphosphatase [Acidobacteriota bacterium]|nr:nucleoside-triphosphatase [Acidobacteriota bacterium]